jgi:biopolymer transport protein ExbB
MQRYLKFRVILFALLMGAIVFAGSSVMGADAAAPAAGAAAGAPVKKSSFFSVFEIDFVFIIILILSIFGLTLIIQGFIKARASVMMPESSTNTIREMIANRQFKELIEFTENDPSFVSKALNPALKRAPSFAAMKEAMETAVAEQTSDQFRKIEYLNIIGNLGPLLGLLGTVMGMIVAFQAMKDAEGQASPATLAGGISIALAHTFLGLALALPCLACFGVLRTMVDRLTVRGALIAEELLLMVKPAEAKPAAAAAIGSPARPGVMPQPAPAPAGTIRKGPVPPVPNV